MFFAEPPGTIDIFGDDDGRISTSGPPLSEAFLDCLNDRDAQPAVAPFFAAPGVDSPVGSGLDALAPIFGEDGDFDDTATGGGLEPHERRRLTVPGDDRYGGLRDLPVNRRAQGASAT